MAGGLLNLVSEGANNLIIQGGPSQKPYSAPHIIKLPILDFKSFASIMMAYETYV